LQAIALGEKYCDHHHRRMPACLAFGDLSIAAELMSRCSLRLQAHLVGSLARSRAGAGTARFRFASSCTSCRDGKSAAGGDAFCGQG